MVLLSKNIKIRCSKVRGGGVGHLFPVSYSDHSEIKGIERIMDGQKHLQIIKDRWKQLESEPGVFQYNLNVLKTKWLEGQYKFRAELNPDRSKLRRIPQTINSLNPTFDCDKFNFSKIKPQEKLLDILFRDSVVSFIVNQSPLTAYHSLICPDLEKLQPQRITKSCIEFSVDFLLSIDERGFRIGYNSPGALASVNHLHLHLMLIDYDLYIDTADVKVIGEGEIHRLDPRMPTEAICFLIEDGNKESAVQSVYDLIEFLCQRDIPHNVFITPDRKHSAKRIKLFIFAREEHCIIKDLTTFNVAFCEFSGYIPVGDLQLYDSLTEARVLEKITRESGKVYNLIYKYLSEL